MGGEELVIDTGRGGAGRNSRGESRGRSATGGKARAAKDAAAATRDDVNGAEVEVSGERDAASATCAAPAARLIHDIRTDGPKESFTAESRAEGRPPPSLPGVRATGSPPHSAESESGARLVTWRWRQGAARLGREDLVLAKRPNPSETVGAARVAVGRRSHGGRRPRG